MKEEVAAQVHPVAEATEGVAHHRGGGEVAVAAVAVHAVQIYEVSKMGAGYYSGRHAQVLHEHRESVAILHAFVRPLGDDRVVVHLRPPVAGVDRPVVGDKRLAQRLRYDLVRGEAGILTRPENAPRFQLRSQPLFEEW